MTEIRRNWGESSIRQSILDPDVNERPCKIEPTKKNPGLGRGLARSRFSNPLGLPLPTNHYRGTRVQFYLAPKIGWTCPGPRLHGCTSSRDKSRTLSILDCHISIFFFRLTPNFAIDLTALIALVGVDQADHLAGMSLPETIIFHGAGSGLHQNWNKNNKNKNIQH